MCKKISGFLVLIICVLSGFIFFGGSNYFKDIDTQVFNSDGSIDQNWKTMKGQGTVSSGTKTFTLPYTFAGINTYNCLVEDMTENKIARYTRLSTNSFKINIYLNSGVFDPASNGVVNYVCVGD